MNPNHYVTLEEWFKSQGGAKAKLFSKGRQAIQTNNWITEIVDIACCIQD